jgi:ATP-binding cassette subfamily B multidrug efflux pump
MTSRPINPQQRPNDPPPIFGRMGHGPPGMMGKPEKAKDARVTVLRLWGYLRHQRRELILAICVVLVTTALNVIWPYMLGHAIDAFIIPGDLAGLARYVLVMIGVFVMLSFTTWLQTTIMAGAAQRTVRDIRKDLFDRLQVLPLKFFDQRQHGDLMSRLTNDVENVSQVLADGIIQITSGLLTMIGVAVVMFLINPLLGLVTIIVTSSMTLLLNNWVAPRTRAGFRAQQENLGKLNALIEETITGQRIVKAYHREPVVIEQFNASNVTLRSAAIRAQIYAGFMGPLMNFTGNIGLAIIACTGGWLAVMGMATVGTIAAFITYARQFGRPLTELATLYNELQSAIAGAERVFAIVDEPAEIDATQTQAQTDLRGEVIFEDVNFSYAPDVPVLKRINLHAQPGQIVALVGPTGAGKTTIVNVLTRFYEIDSGRIIIDGRDIRDFEKDDLRRQLGIVLQDTYLFTGTVMENIRYGRLDASDDEVIAAAKLANADQFIHRLPQGYATPLSERASNLSQGQRQLLAIARAILANPRILILDEATSSVDTRTEQHIQEAMRRLMAGRTSFVIAHRLSTIREADQILVINAGEVIERGRHADLLAQQGFYAHLYASQFHEEAGGVPAVVAS